MGAEAGVIGSKSVDVVKDIEFSLSGRHPFSMFASSNSTWAGLLILILVGAFLSVFLLGRLLELISCLSKKAMSRIKEVETKMFSVERILAWFVVVIVAAMFLFPPFTGTFFLKEYDNPNGFIGYHFIFSNPVPSENLEGYESLIKTGFLLSGKIGESSRIDFLRLFVQVAGILIIAWLVQLTLRSGNAKRGSDKR